MSRLASLNPANRTPTSPSSRATASPSRNLNTPSRDPTTFHSILRDINNEVRTNMQAWDDVCVKLFGSAKGAVDEGTEIELVCLAQIEYASIVYYRILYSASTATLLPSKSLPRGLQYFRTRLLMTDTLSR
ncbi:hypothetical protein QFC19_000114 [Naganishia cerealis]|uniref:Uncharacterized protein n=1 Tax=Naganishia cerealis TaxID=610337 RepID=A0ACC2WQ62_9TREE|nr:hypothetical protein QFC19_000114 [Naganishia cerealis]